MSSLAGIAAELAHALECEVQAPARRVHGGDASHSVRFESARGPLFVKLGAAESPVLVAEAAALGELAGARAIRVPAVLAQGRVGAWSYLALEWLPFVPATRRSQVRLGEQLAQLHRVHAASFGWRLDNTIGVTSQLNTPSPHWLSFYRECRLGPQLALALERGMPQRSHARGQLLVQLMDAFFASHAPRPSLLHGDLWGGNWGALAGDVPVSFDPALYYGDREADLAMTRLFGGFSADFYTAYAASWPLEAGSATRETLYNLYHVLNHFNIFGGGYLAQAESMIERLLAELGR